ncbi:MAG: type II secretion system protein GspN [Candidatus Schekmanbacteria bacterium]|nr:MAG: type II secretion system protein GspN [Candidatus Schekmanbacteria bacterium]
MEMAILKNIKGNFLRISLYTIFGIICFFFFFLIKFPFDIFVQNALSTIEKNYDINISIDESSYSFPIGVKLTKVNISAGEDNSLEYSIDEVKIKYPLFSFLFFKKEFAIYANAFDGSIYGSFESNNEGIYLNISTTKAINMEKAIPETSKNGFALIGMTNFKIEGIIVDNDLRTFSGRGKIEISKGAIKNISPLLKAIPVEKADLEFESSRNRSAIKNINIEGNGIRIKGQGTLKTGKTLSDSILKLKLFGQYDPSTGVGKTISLLGIKGKKNIPIELSGPLTKPTLKIEGKTLWNKKSPKDRKRKR